MGKFDIAVSIHMYMSYICLCIYIYIISVQIVNFVILTINNDYCDSIFNFDGRFCYFND